MLNSTLQFRPPSLYPFPRPALITRPTKAFIFQPNPIIKFEGLSFLRPPLLDFISELRSTVSLLVQAKPPTSDKSSEQKWVHEGVITESLPNGMFSVKLDNKDSIIGYISGKIRKNFVRILPGDRVRVEVSRYDTSKGRIVYRLRSSS